MKCPIVGDNKYSGINKSIPEYDNKDNNLPIFLQQQMKKKYPLHLHCLKLEIPKINSNDYISVFSEPPHYFHSFLKKNLREVDFKNI